MQEIDLDALEQKHRLPPEEEEKRLKRVALLEQSRKELRDCGYNPDSPLFKLPLIF